MKTYRENEVARMLNCSRATLRRMRREHRGPRWTRVGRMIRYPDEWMTEYVERHAGVTEEAIQEH